MSSNTFSIAVRDRTKIRFGFEAKHSARSDNFHSTQFKVIIIHRWYGDGACIQCIDLTEKISHDISIRAVLYFTADEAEKTKAEMEAKIEKLTAEVAKVKKQKRASAKLAAESMEKANAMMAKLAEEGT